jgi:hypothetical protein
MHRTAKLIAISLIALLMAAAGIVFVGDGWALRRGSDEIRRNLLADTPLGSSVDTVSQQLRSRGLNPLISSKGFLRQPIGSAMSVVGVSSVRAELGHYRQFPFPIVSVTAFWGFDAGDRLIDVWVWKTTDAL